MNTKVLRILDFHQAEFDNLSYVGDAGRDFSPFYYFAKNIFTNADIEASMKEVFPESSKTGDMFESEINAPLRGEILQKFQNLAKHCHQHGWLDLNSSRLKSKFGDFHTYQDLFMYVLKHHSISPDPSQDLRFLISFLGAAITDLLWEELIKFADQEPQGPMKFQLQKELAKLRADGKDLHSWATEEFKKTTFAVSAARGLTFLDSQDYLKQIEKYFDDIKNGCPNGRPQIPNFESYKWDWIKAECQRMILALRSYFIERQSVQETIKRYRFLAERFGKSLLLNELAKHPSQKEKVCQEHLDQYLFSLGITPITHAEAVHGRWDTLAKDAMQEFSDLFGESYKENPAVLFELKQSLGNSPLTDSDLKKTYDLAASQAKSYKDYIESVHKSEATCFIIIFYNGANRWSYSWNESSDIKPILIYLGDQPASKIKGTLNL